MKQAPVVEEHPAGARKLGRPARVDKALEATDGIRAHDKSAVSGVAQVDEDTNRSLKVRRAGVGHEASELRGGVGDVDARHIRKPKEPADDGHVRIAKLGHLVVLDGAENGLIGGRELEAFLNRRVEVARARAIEVRLELRDEVGGVEALRQGQRTSSAVASDRGVEDPLELALVLGREASRDVGNKART